jgi:hypothetical protein
VPAALPPTGAGGNEVTRWLIASPAG